MTTRDSFCPRCGGRRFEMKPFCPRCGLRYDEGLNAAVARVPPGPDPDSLVGPFVTEGAPVESGLVGVSGLSRDSAADAANPGRLPPRLPLWIVGAILVIVAGFMFWQSLSQAPNALNAEQERWCSENFTAVFEVERAQGTFNSPDSPDNPAYRRACLKAFDDR